MNSLTLGSLFDGSGGFPLGGLIFGITPVWASEIEPFPIRVTTKRFPFMKHYGDISQMDGGKIEPVDIICFGSPCTDMSIAGRRAGLEGKQSVLFYEAIRIIKEMRCATNGKYPRWICWENVPALSPQTEATTSKPYSIRSLASSKKMPRCLSLKKESGPSPTSTWVKDGALLTEFLTLNTGASPSAENASIYLVGDLAGQRAGEVLFKSEGLSGYSAEGFRAWQGAARCVEKGAGTTGYGIDGYNGSVDDVAATLGVNCGMSTGRNGVVLNDQGGNRMDVTHEVTCTLRAEAHHPPVVMDEPPISLENHPTDGRVRISDATTVQTLTSRMGTGGNNVPLVMKIRCGCAGGGKGALIQTNKSATLSCNNDQTLFEPKAFGISSKESNGMKSDNPHVGFYEADTAKTLDGNGGNPGCNQGGIAVVESYAIQGSMIGRSPQNGPQGDGINEDVSFTLNTVDRHAVYSMTTGSFMQFSEEMAPTVLARDYKDPTAVCYGIGRDTFNQGKNAKFAPTFVEELQPTLVAKGPGAIQSGYTVRRLTPTECARLQGFPDWWCDCLGTEEPTEADIAFWTEVWETHRRIVSPNTKPKSRNQIIKWLRDPHSDAAEYKMWGNGVALPCVCFVLAGIVYCTQ